MQPHLFPNNTRSNFYSYINPRDLDYISNESEIEVAVKSLTIDNDLDRNKKLVLKSTLSKETISSYGFDNIIALFSVRKNKKGINIYRFENPVFFLLLMKDCVNHNLLYLIQVQTSNQILTTGLQHL